MQMSLRSGTQGPGFTFSYFAAIYYLKSIMKLPELDPDQVIFPKTTGIFMRECSEEEILTALLRCRSLPPLILG